MPLAQVRPEELDPQLLQLLFRQQNQPSEAPIPPTAPHVGFDTIGLPGYRK